jgi:hypothetical protein
MYGVKKISCCISISPRRHCLALIVRKPSDEKLLHTVLLHFVLNLIQVKIWPPTEKNARNRKPWWQCYGRICVINFALPSKATAAGMHDIFSGKRQSWKASRNRDGRWRKSYYFCLHKPDVFPVITIFLEASNFKKHNQPWRGVGSERLLLVL